MRVITVALCCLILAACGSSGDTADVDSGATAISSESGGKVTLGVNSYLWHASLDTLSFMPLASADPFGGVIITDWYSAPDNANERMKVTVYILDRAPAGRRAQGRGLPPDQDGRRQLGRCPGQSGHGHQAGRRDPDPGPRASARERRFWRLIPQRCKPLPPPAAAIRAAAAKEL